ncbi:MAG: glutamyl-tRNA reductase [Dehalococcoidia bacterium]|nr:glutamyl-tRNA reductase [Dehalococcoidia bacterium]
MQLLSLGLNHKTAPVEIRERVALTTGQIGEALTSLHKYVPQGVIVSTCNRTEVYTLADQDYVKSQLATGRFLSEYGRIPIDQLAPYLYTYQSEDAARHLFRVASGLESMILGEYEVLGQVRTALEKAEGSGLVHLPLLNLFRQAVRVGRRVRDETEISKNGLSVSSAAVDLSRKCFPNLAECDVLVISAGEAAMLAVKALAKAGVGKILVTSRSYDKAAELASGVGGQAVAFHLLGQALSSASIVVSCSGAPHFILDSTAISEAMKTRPDRKLLLLDIAVPRDVNPEVKSIPNVLLYDIDDLKEVSESNRSYREAEVGKVTAIVEAETKDFSGWWKALEVRPTITALVGKAEKIRQAELARTLSKMPALSTEDQQRIEAMSASLVRKLLHDPIRNLKNGGLHENHIQVLRELFELHDDGQASNSCAELA